MRESNHLHAPVHHTAAPSYCAQIIARFQNVAFVCVLAHLHRTVRTHTGKNKRLVVALYKLESFDIKLWN